MEMNVFKLIASTNIILVLFHFHIIGDEIQSEPVQKYNTPAMTDGPPAAGRRVKVTTPEFQKTDVYHSLYLPKNWEKGRKYPVIVEYTGNYFPQAGSTGRVEDASLGFGLSGGEFIWVILPFVDLKSKTNARTWWGDESATTQYAKTNIPRICREFGGDPDRVFLCGFSRGAIAVNYIGLADDEIARLWAGFITHDHYDGERAWNATAWGKPLEVYRKSAEKRLGRLHGRPVLVMQADSTKSIADYLGENTKQAQFTFLDIQMKSIFPKLPHGHVIHPHNDKWLLYDHPLADQARRWLKLNADQ
jgi:hypothetical protein